MSPAHENESVGTTCFVVRSRAKTSVSMLCAGICGWIWYQKKSQKLPKEVGTSGKAPPKDDKPAGGGTDFQDIG
jgi:hypothetical protein